MRRSAIGSVVDKLLLVSVVAVVVTGVVVDQLDLHEFRLHSWFGYAMAALAAIHVAMHWRRRRLRRQAPVPSQPVDGTLQDTFADSVEPEPESPETRGITRRGVLAGLGAGLGGVLVGWFVRAEASPEPYDGGDAGLFYHRQSSLGLAGLFDSIVNWGTPPKRYKSYQDVAVPLPDPEAPPTMTVAQALEQRRSLREYADRALTSEELAWLVHAATGITSGGGFRTAPSAGALYPIETYVAASRVDGVDPGLYHVDLRNQALERLRSGAVAGDVMVAGLGQGFLGSAPVVFILTGLFQRTRWKYHQRHYRYVCWEAGHMAQNMYLAAEAAGLGACVVGAFLDSSLNGLLDIDGRQEAALGLVAVGPR